MFLKERTICERKNPIYAQKNVFSFTDDQVKLFKLKPGDEIVFYRINCERHRNYCK